MLFDPTGSAVVWYVAVPPARATVFSAVAPSVNVTLPVGVPLPDAGATVSVSVTLVPAVIFVGDALSVLMVAVNAACVTVIVTAADVLPPNVDPAG